MPTTPDRRELFQRYEGNPLIRASDFPRMVNATFNPAAVEVGGRHFCSCASRSARGSRTSRWRRAPTGGLAGCSTATMSGPLVCLAVTRDFVHFERCGVLLPPEDKEAALFPTLPRRQVGDAPPAVAGDARAR